MAAEMNAALIYLLEEKQVAAETIAKLKELGINTVSRLCLWVDDRKELRQVLKDDLGLDPALDRKFRIEQIAMVDAWESAKSRLDEQSKVDAEKRSAGLPLSMAKQDHKALRDTTIAVYDPMGVRRPWG